MRLFVFLAMLIISSSGSAQDVQQLAMKSLEGQIVELDGGLFFKAGQHQFNTLWTRDFAYSIESLLLHKKFRVVKNHLSFLFNNLSEDGQVPLYADSTQPMWRVTLATAKIALPKLPDLKLKSSLKVYYKVSAKHPVIDSNALTIIGACLYVKSTGDKNFLAAHKEKLLEIWRYYDRKKNNIGLIEQAPFSDWQDSARREGEVFLTQLLYWKATVLLEEVLGIEILNTTAFKTRLLKSFFTPSTGLFRITPFSQQRSLEDQLLAIHFGFIQGNEAQELYFNLKKDLLWNDSGPGRATYPSYKKEELNWYVKFVGLSEYHGSLHWSWLWGLTGTVALKLKDEITVAHMENILSQILYRDGYIGEVYFPDENHALFSKRLYKSEIPFGWGSAYVAQFLHLLQAKE